MAMGVYNSVEEMVNSLGDSEFSALFRKYLANRTKATEMVVARHKAGLTVEQLAKKANFQPHEIHALEDATNDKIPSHQYEAYTKACQ